MYEGGPILAGISYDALPDAPLERFRELAGRYRRTLLAHRDGAALVTGTYPAEPNTLRFADRLINALLDAGADERQAAWTVWTVSYFTLGLAQEEQAAPDEGDERLARAVKPSTHPALQQVMPHLRRNFDERFAFGLETILSQIPA
ncbi:TetR/AcrR family transcriptional regulator C-terminal domain-containing protein [Streptomyces toyocaensis]|uniref:TetR/AcrR family transcriptional regulator C-terminal domain-containing protein n=1 Tax=Streptomyces toyocaensis TaxID=55952 RepID=UPI0033DFBE60